MSLTRRSSFTTKVDERDFESTYTSRIVRRFSDEWLLRSTLRKCRNQSLSLRQKDNFTVSRAVEMRRLKLMWRAFDHWRIAASSEVNKLATAERHMLRFRYFNGWKDVTVIQRLKIERFQKSKFLTLWWQQRTKLRALDEAATRTYRGSLLRNAFRAWLMEYCGRRAPLWKSENRTRKVFMAWLDQTRLQNARENYVDTVLRPHRLGRTQFVHWHRLSQRLTNFEKDAMSLRNRSLLRKTLKAWTQSTTLKPKLSLFEAERNTQVARKTIASWRFHTKLSRDATTCHDAHVLRRAFKMWNVTLRCSYMIEDINVRVQAEALYRWSLATRICQANRKLDVKSLRNALVHWREKATEQRTTLDDLAHSFGVTQRRLQMLSSLHHWYSKLHKHQQAEELAIVFRRRKLLEGNLQGWRKRLQNLHRLEEQASAARFYISTKSSLRSWQNATHQHQRLRRREAFAVLRRNTKIRVVREMLQRLRHAVVNIHAMDRIAIEKAEDTSLQLVLDTFARWRSRTQSAQAHSGQALMHMSQKLLATNIEKWKRRLHTGQRLGEVAVSFHTATIEREASNCFRRLDRRRFQVKGQDLLAVQLRERHTQKHVKSMLRYWADRAAALREGAAKRSDIPDATEDDQHEDEDLQGVRQPTERPGALQGSTFYAGLPSDRFVVDADALGGELTFEGNTVLTSTPIPGYLRTPSRRMARAKARERLVNRDGTNPGVTTPALGFNEAWTAASEPPAPSASTFSRTGQVTPFERKLRSQGYSEYQRSDRIGVGSSIVANSKSTRFVGFDDVEEDVEPPQSLSRH